MCSDVSKWDAFGGVETHKAGLGVVFFHSISFAWYFFLGGLGFFILYKVRRLPSDMVKMNYKFPLSLHDNCSLCLGSGFRFVLVVRSCLSEVARVSSPPA